MKSLILSIATISGLSALMIAPVVLTSPASAQPAPGAAALGFDGSYVGAGVAAGVTSGGQGNDAANFGGQVQGRLAAPNVPVSLRGTVMFNDQNSNIIPTVSYDLPVAPNTNVYAGVGYSFVQNQGKVTPLGNRDAVVLTAGAESEVARNVVLYGDAKLGLNAYQNSSASALSLQTGVGFKF